MSDIRTSVTLVDNFSSPAKGMAAAMNAAASECEKMKKVMGTAPDMSEYNRVREQFTALGNAERQAATQAKATADALDEQADKLRMSAQAAQAKADAEKKAVSVYEQEYKAYEKNISELGVLTEAQKKSIERYREAYEEKKKAAEQAQNLADRLKTESEMADKAAQSARKEAEAFEEVNDSTEKMGGSFGMAADSMSNLMMAAGGYKIMQLVKSAFEETTAAAIEYESAMTGVYKTVDGTREQLAQLSSDVRSMALSMPSSTTEIAGVMESAGQLGIATESVTDFAKTMIDLGNATNLTADQAASSLAKFANITGMSADNYRNLGSVIVDLGNNFATTEADIVNMSTYLTSAASVAGFAETDILALSAAMSSVGINAEAGGSSMSKLISEMQTAVEVGGEGLTAFADVAGMSAQQFSTEWGTNAVGALQAFIVGLNDVERNGKSMSVLLQDLDLDDIRMSNMLKALAQGNTVLTSAVEKANTAWEENVALTNEVEKRYATLESKTQMMKNAADDLKISVGNSLTPAMGLAADAATGLMEGLSGFARENQALTAGIMGTVGTLGTAVGGFTTLAPAITAASTAMQAFNISTKAMGIGLGVVGGIAALAGVTVALTTAFSNANDEVEDYNGTLEECAAEIESIKAAHEKAVGMYGKESNAAKQLEGQLDTLNAQYEKGGGAAEDYAQRIEATAKSFKKITDDYNDKIKGIESSQIFAQTAVSQLEALQDKANKTNPDLELMGKYADYLNDTFQCNIEVNYETGELTGFDPVEVGTKKAKEAAEQKRKDAAFEYVTDPEFQKDYVDTVNAMTSRYNNLPNITAELDKWIEQFNWADDDTYRFFDSKGNIADEFKPKYKGEKYNYQAIYKRLQTAYDGDRYEDIKSLSMLMENSGLQDIINYENAIAKYKEIRGQARDAFNVYGTPDQTEGYLAGLTKDNSIEPVINSVSDLEYYMGDLGITAETTSESMTKSFQAIESKYDDMYGAAQESFIGQFKLFDEAEADVNATADAFLEAQKKQTEYWSSYADNISYLSQYTAQQWGMTQEQYDNMRGYLTSGTAEAAGLAASLREKVEKEGEGVLRSIGEAKTGVSEAQEQMSEAAAMWGLDMEERTTHAVGKTIEAIKGTGEGIQLAGQTLMERYAAGLISGGMSSAVSAARQVADSIQSAFNNISISVPNVSINSASDARMYLSGHYASGTMSAAPGLALVGENGPELVNFGGGEVVYTADETKRMMQNMTDVYIPKDINEAIGMKEPEWNGSWSDGSGGSRDKTITINIGGGDTIRVQGSVSRDDVCDLLVSNLKPALMSIISEEIFEEGNGSYEY